MNLSLIAVAAIALTPTLAAKVLAVMASVYAVIQGIKKAFPQLSGWWAVAINIALSIAGAVVVVPPDQLFSIQTLTTLLLAGIAAAGAAGIHGTVQNLGPGASSAPSTPAPPASRP